MNLVSILPSPNSAIHMNTTVNTQPSTIYFAITKNLHYPITIMVWNDISSDYLSVSLAIDWENWCFRCYFKSFLLYYWKYFRYQSCCYWHSNFNCMGVWRRAMIQILESWVYFWKRAYMWNDWRLLSVKNCDFII